MRITEFEWDDHNEPHVARRIAPADVETVPLGRYITIRNKRTGTGDYKVIGRDRSGGLITVIVAATDSPTVWRPITAMQANRHERTLAERAGI